MLWHQMSLVRLWSQLAWVVRSGEPAVRQASIRGAEADRAAFIAAMHSVSGPVADGLVARLGPPQFEHLLDVGGASGTWTLAFLSLCRKPRRRSSTCPTLSNKPASGSAKAGWPAASARVGRLLRRFAARRGRPGLGQRDRPPACAGRQPRVVRQGPRRAGAGGRIMVRDVVMEPDRVAPAEGALFAINMLVATACGGTFT